MRTLLIDIKQRIRKAQTKAILSANSELISMYWDIGKMLVEKQKVAGWGAAVIPRLSKDIHNELPQIKGFSERNIGYMIRFAREYETSILQQAVAKLPDKTMLLGFAFVGRQYHLEISDKDFYIDLLFFHLRLRCFIFIELKKGEFKPESSFTLRIAFIPNCHE